MSYRELSPVEVDALRELSNIGAGHAATALSQMLGRAITLKVPSVRSLPFKDVPATVGGAEMPVVGLFMRIYGDTKGNILLTLPQESVAALIGSLTGKAPDEKMFREELHLEIMQESVLKEIGNILAGAFLSTLSQALKINLVPSVPGLAYDMAGAVLDALFIELGQVGDTALLVETEFLELSKEVQGHFFLIPDPQSLEVILGAMAKMKW